MVNAPVASNASGTEPVFSVLVATYNQGDYVLQTLDTVAAQTFGDYELIVVNDGSTDATEEKVSEWLQNFRRTHANRAILSTIPNSGQSAAMEHGFLLSTGRYVCLLDSDDLWVPEKLREIYRALSDDPAAGMIVHPLYVIDANGRRTGDVRPKRAKLSDGDLREQIRTTSRLAAPATSGMVIRADVFRRLVPMPTKRFKTAADLYLALGAALYTPVRALSVPLAEYRMHPDGQHIQTMLSTDGVRRWVDIQSTVAEHLGLQQAVARNSFFMRHVFALAKFDAGAPQQIAAFLRLARATWLDDSFGIHERLLLTGYWTACLLAPRSLFLSLWRAFHMKQTGFDKIGLAAGRNPSADAAPRQPVS